MTNVPKTIQNINNLNGYTANFNYTSIKTILKAMVVNNQTLYKINLLNNYLRDYNQSFIAKL